SQAEFWTTKNTAEKMRNRASNSPRNQSRGRAYADVSMAPGGGGDERALSSLLGRCRVVLHVRHPCVVVVAVDVDRIGAKDHVAHVLGALRALQRERDGERLVAVRGGLLA